MTPSQLQFRLRPNLSNSSATCLSRPVANELSAFGTQTTTGSQVDHGVWSERSCGCGRVKLIGAPYIVRETKSLQRYINAEFCLGKELFPYVYYLVCHTYRVGCSREA